MASVSQNGRRKPRPWTAQDQIVAEVAAACGVSYREIGRVLGFSDTSVARRLIPAVAEKQRESQRRFYERNPDKLLEFREYSRRWHTANRDKIRPRARRWQIENADKVIEHARTYRQANPDKATESRRRWDAANPGKNRERARRRRDWKRSARRRALRPVTLHQIDARFALWQDRCAFCGVPATDPRNHGIERLTVEHVLALTKGGLDEAANILPACSTCNTSKNNSPVEDWYRRQQFFAATRWRKIERYCPAAAMGQLPLALTA
jgi:hypothetical protein